MLDKTFDPKSAEPRLYAAWEASGAFQPTDNPAAEPFSIVIPPPNVTGNLHIGHALNNTLQDVLIRFQRMRGKAALWLPGTDHAGIATQMVVERQLAAAGNIGRRDMGREAFVAKVWEWKAESGDQIVQQLRRLGASCDWSRERFTLDEGLSAAVRKVFVQLYKQGLLYRDKRLVNWDPQFQTAISDLEVETREEPGKMWWFAYPLEGEPIDGVSEIVIATTRPETMLGDGAVAVHPDDERYKKFVGRMVRLPIADRLIPIIADEYPDPEKGSGAVKITGAHDFNDFQVAVRHNLSLLSIMDEQARMAGPIPERYLGKPREEARKMVLEEIEALGLLRDIEEKLIARPYGDRSGVIIEPFLTDQWYVDAKTLAQPAIKAVEQGDMVFEPRNWEKTYFEWMRNIEPWCVSRQLWWGHRIPAWYDDDGGVYVEETEEAAQAAAGNKSIRQDEDVLDTWFSSGLWPFSTMGWPENTEDLKRFYPTNTLVTSFDIIFFWVARMMMMGLHFTGEVPFKRVFINALVRDAKGQKMSKSKGNVVDPLGLVDKYGADALRFTLTAMSGQARDIKLAEQRIEGYRNFGTKLWNVANFCQRNGCVRVAGYDPAAATQQVNRWIVGETAKTAELVTKALEAAAFDEAANGLYRFIWNTVCDWYVELAKPILNGPDGAAKDETRATVAWVLDQCLVLLHPVMPFITEELWAQTAEGGPDREGFLMSTAWPELPLSLVDTVAEREIGLVIDAITEGRSVRQGLNVPASAKPALLVIEGADWQLSTLDANAALVAQLLRVSEVRREPAVPEGAIPFVVNGATLALPVAEFIDLAAEKARLAKELAGLDKEIARFNGKLGNPEFVAKAPEAVIEENREKLAEAETAKSKLESALARLAAVG
ncbi:MAG: valine--tRNA ligase [Caulobacterales bacterium 68-7]|nr:valine--tRNA ligase [Caulobacterales bacterium]OJU09238.1 MAG: valine--tRNA ligase [Caulobacterales bacterium 68-7]